VNFYRTPHGSKWFFVGKNSHVPVKSINTCKLDIYDGRTLLLHNIFFASDIQRNLISIVVFLIFEFTLNIYGTIIKLYQMMWDIYRMILLF
jgi:hypothetical protein